jgi:hypothetical protein
VFSPRSLHAVTEVLLRRADDARDHVGVSAEGGEYQGDVNRLREGRQQHREHRLDHVDVDRLLHQLHDLGAHALAERLDVVGAVVGHRLPRLSRRGGERCDPEPVQLGLMGEVRRPLLEQGDERVVRLLVEMLERIGFVQVEHLTLLVLGSPGFGDLYNNIKTPYKQVINTKMEILGVACSKVCVSDNAQSFLIPPNCQRCLRRRKRPRS